MKKREQGRWTKEMTELKNRENMEDDRVEEGENRRFLIRRRKEQGGELCGSRKKEGG